MADAYIKARLGQSRKVYSAFTPDVGTETLSSCTVSIYDDQGAIAGSVSDVAATGITSGAAAAPQAWYQFAPGTLSLTRGYYIISFKCTDSNGDIFISNIGAHVVNRYQ